MTSQKSTQAAKVITAADELKRFARSLEYRTRDLRESVAAFLVGNNNAATTTRDRSDEDDDGLFDDDVDTPGEDWVEVIDNAKNVDEVCLPTSTKKAIIQVSNTLAYISKPTNRTPASKSTTARPPHPQAPSSKPASPPNAPPCKPSASQEPTSNTACASSPKT